MKNVIISGASGFIGSSLVKRLLNEEVHIWTLDKEYREGIFSESDKVTQLNENFDIGKLIDSFDNTNYDSFYNFAWQGVNGPDKGRYDIQTNNIMLTLRYAELAKALGCK